MTPIKNKKNVLYFQSGGPTAVINSSFMGLYKEMKKHRNLNLLVSPYGISGLINNELHPVAKGEVPILAYRPGSYWGSLRQKLPEDPNDPLAKQIVEHIISNNIAYVFPNGGNDSMDTTYKLSKYVEAAGIDVKVIGIPKTIDDDLPMTDHTPGFGSAAKFVANSVIAVSLDDKSYKKGKINIIEVMGRDSGFLTASAVLAGLRGQKPDYIYVPEVAFDVQEFVRKAEKTFDEKGRCLIVVSEGIRDKDGNLIAATGNVDAFGNKIMGGAACYLSSLVIKDGYKSRGIELNVIQRAASFVPSYVDIHEAEMCGAHALKFALQGVKNSMVAMQREIGETYRINYVPISLDDVGGKIVTLPIKYINPEGDNILDSYLEYVAPLIRGNPNPFDEDGLVKLF